MSNTLNDLERRIGFMKKYRNAFKSKLNHTDKQDGKYTEIQEQYIFAAKAVDIAERQLNDMKYGVPNVRARRLTISNRRGGKQKRKTRKHRR